MRLVLITHSWRAGGAARYVRDVAGQMAARGHEVAVWTADAEADVPGWVVPVRQPVERWLRPLELAPGRTDWRHRGSIRRLGALDAASVDLVHLNLLGGGWLSLGAVAELCRRVPTVWTHHDEWAATDGLAVRLEGKLSRQAAAAKLGGLYRLLGMSPYHDSFKSRSLGRLLDRRAPRPTVHICPSEHLAGMIRESARFARQFVRVIPHGTSLAEHKATTMDRDEARRRLAVPVGMPVVLMLAQHVHDVHKGLDLAVEALREVHGRRPVHVLLMGRGAEAFGTRLAPIPCTAGYADSDEALAQAYRAADVTVIPSLAESFCYVAIESLACRTPFVSFAVGGLVEIAQKGRHGRLARCFDPRDLAAQVASLLEDDAQRRVMGEAGWRWVKHECTLSVMTDRLQRVYDEAVARFGPANDRCLVSDPAGS